MPPLDEGTLLYMPSTLPGISIAEAQKLLQIQDRIIKQFPEVERVLGKAGRAETSTDPAPLSMLETIDHAEAASAVADGRHAGTRRGRREWLAALFRRITPDRISQDELVAELDAALQLPGVSNAWTMPIKARTSTC